MLLKQMIVMVTDGMKDMKNKSINSDVDFGVTELIVELENGLVTQFSN